MPMKYNTKGVETIDLDDPYHKLFVETLKELKSKLVTVAENDNTTLHNDNEKKGFLVNIAIKFFTEIIVAVCEDNNKDLDNMWKKSKSIIDNYLDIYKGNITLPSKGCIQI